MADIFISHASEDRRQALALAEILKKEGFTVRCDDLSRSLANRDFESCVKHEIDLASIVLVLWSGHAADSRRVCREAAVASEAGKLLAARLDAAEPPAHLANHVTSVLSGWDGSPDDPAIRALVATLRKWRAPAALARPARQAPATARPMPPAPARPPTTAQPRPRGPILGRMFDGLRSILGRKSPASTGPASSSGRGEKATPGRGPRIGEKMTGAEREAGLDTAMPDVFGGTASAPEPQPEPVLLAAAAPRRSEPGSQFSAVLVAYIEAARASAIGKLEALGEEDDRRVTDVAPSRDARWRIGTPVTVRLAGDHLDIAPSEIRFEWNGRENLAAFAVRVRPDAPSASVQMVFQVLVADVPIAYIPMKLAIAAQAAPTVETNQVEGKLPKSAFASYSSRDAELVTQRLSTLARWTPGLDIFQDCLDLQPNEAFKPQLSAQIASRDAFLLFWSRHAAASPWVQWEYQTARDTKGLQAILPMPLEDPAIAPPPAEFADAHMRDRFMLAGYGLAKVREEAGRAGKG